MSNHNQDEFYDEGKESLMKLFDESEIGYLARLKSMFIGLTKSPDTREYKVARIELQRLSAPMAAIFLPIIAILVMIVVSAVMPQKETIMVADLVEQTIEPEALKEIEPPEPPPPDENVQVDVTIDAPSVNAPPAETAAQANEMSPKPADFDTVSIVKSPVKMKNVFGSRNPGLRGALISGGGGDAKTEAAVMASLRWLKHNQNPNGSFPSKMNSTAMTSLGVLAFLAHGERPGDPQCEEFGDTVQKAVEFLIKAGSRNNDGNGYALAMQAYALSEAYGMTMNPNVGAAAAKAITLIVKGQHETGGWQYSMANPDPRDDISLGGWCAQAIKAASLAKVKVDGLQEAYAKSIKGMKYLSNAKNGRFQYTKGSDSVGLTAVGVLCMQLLGASGDPVSQNGMKVLDELFVPTFAKEGVKGGGGSPQYYCYYATQVRFFQGGQRWKTWNDQMKPLYLSAQQLIKDTYEWKGKKYDMGFWENEDGHSDRPTMDTCLAALQLMVYYRNLPTTKIDTNTMAVESEIVKAQQGDINVDTGGL